MNQTRKNQLCGLVSWRYQNLGALKRKGKLKTKRAWHFTHLTRDAAIRAIVLNFDMPGDIANVITRTKFHVSRFRDFGAVTPPNLAISIGLAGRSYDSVGTAVLHCDLVISVSLGLLYCLFLWLFLLVLILFSHYQPTDWLVRTSPKWPVLCRVVC